MNDVLPPTPTLLPTVSPEDVALGLQVPPFNLWDSAPTAIQSWNSAAIATSAFQFLVLIGLIYVIFIGLSAYFQRMSDDLQ
jgi:hypothetical protein